MFVTDSEFFLSLHRTHANELRAEAARERLARYAAPPLGTRLAHAPTTPDPTATV